MKIKKSIFACMLLSAAMACAETPDAWCVDLVEEFRAMSQLATPANTWPCSRDGTWSVTANGATPSYYTNNGMVGFKGASNYPKILANVTTESKTGPDGGSVKAGEIYYHPNNSGIDQIRYTAAVEGTFAVTGLVRRVNSNASGNGIRLYVYADGVLLTNVTTATVNTAYPFAVSVPLLAGAELDVRLDANGGYSFDATGLICCLMRTGPYSFPATSRAAEALRIAAAGKAVNNPVRRANGRPGSWSFLKRSGSTESLMSCLHEDASHPEFRGLATASSSSAVYPRLLLNTGTSDIVPTDASSSVAGGELYYHPDATTKTVLRYKAERTGRYGYSGRIRDVCKNGGNGVHVVVDVCGYRRSDFILPAGGNQQFAEGDLMVSEGNSIELILDANGDHAFDATALQFDVTLEEDCSCGMACSLQKAVRENVAAASSSAALFAASDGGIWSFGVYGDGKGFAPSDFIAFETPIAKSNVEGWCLPNHIVNGLEYPHIAVSTDGISGNPLGYWCDANEVAHHPYNGTYTAFRFHAPGDGIYSFKGRLTARDTASTGTGLDATVVINGRGFPVSGVACANGKEGSAPTIRPAVSNVWLRAGETLDFSIGPNGAFNNDGSGLDAIVTRENNLPTDPIISFDIVGASRDSCSGAGRIGLSSDGPWVRLVVPSAASSAHSRPVKRDGRRLAVRLELSRMAGNLVAGMTASVPVPVSDGVVSSGADDPISFRVTGLTPNAAYTFYAYSRNASKENGVFAVDGTEVAATDCWFVRTGGDWCAFTAEADGEGVVSGTFCGTADGAATFCALQVTGAEFPEGVPPGLLLMVR